MVRRSSEPKLRAERINVNRLSNSWSRMLCLLACLVACVFDCAGCCSIACRLGPTNENEIAARELARLGLDSMHHGNLTEAKARFMHALEKSPKNPQARHHLARLLWQQGDMDGAIEAMDTAILHSGGDPEWTVELGRMLLAQGDHQAALRCSDVALQSAPDLPTAWQLRGDVSAQTNKLDSARQAYHRSLTEASSSSDTLIKLSEIYSLQGKPLRALATLQRLEESIPATEQPPIDLRYRQALAQQALGRFDDACETFALRGTKWAITPNCYCTWVSVSGTPVVSRRLIRQQLQCRGWRLATHGWPVSTTS